MGKGLGNRFLDDLRHADALVHVVDVSGTTDAEGMEIYLYMGTWDVQAFGRVGVRELIWVQAKRREATTQVKTSYGSVQKSYAGYKGT
jgi:ribosome-binding ATPase YchF (GTP1/OBG family)